jgi:hypothetical protein
MKIIISTLILFSFIYILTYSTEEWTDNNLEKTEVYDNELPYLDSTARIIDSLSEVEYAAIIYPRKHRVYPNSILQKHILGNPKESTLYGVKADVLYTIIGESMTSITYTSSGTSIGSSAIFVGLCESDGEFYAPDNGYEFPATQEAIAFVKGLDKKTYNQSTASACPN